MPLSNYIPSSRISQSGVCTSSTRPASPYEGQIIFETDTDKLLVWDGSVWTLLKTHIIQPVAQPMFSVILDNGSGAAATSKITFNGEILDVGSCWDSTNNRFIAPIGGNYELIFSFLAATSSATTVTIYKNGSAMAIGSAPRGYTQTQYSALCGNGIMTLAATDYIEVWVTTGSIHPFHGHFSGKLVS